MVDLTGVLPTWIPLVAADFARQGVPWPVWVSIMWEESGLNPYAHNTRPPDDSVGLLQLNRNGGQGQGYSVEQLQNPMFNVAIGGPYIARAYHASPDDIESIAINSGHPGPVPKSDARVQRIKRTYNTIKVLDFPSAIAGLISHGIQLPDVPSLPGIVADPAGAVWSGIKGVGTKIADAIHAGTGLAIEGAGNWVGVSVGTACIVIGLLKSPPGQMTVEVVKDAGIAVATGGAGAAAGAASAGASAGESMAAAGIGARQTARRFAAGKQYARGAGARSFSRARKAVRER